MEIENILFTVNNFFVTKRRKHVIKSWKTCLHIYDAWDVGKVHPYIGTFSLLIFSTGLARNKQKYSHKCVINIYNFNL